MCHACVKATGRDREHDMKLHEALRKTIRPYGISVIEDKRLMSFLGDYHAFDDFPAMKDVMRCIATGDYGKKLCLAADGSDDDFLRFASELKEALVREKSFKEEFADYAIESISFALGIPCAAAVTEPGDHGFEAVQKNNGSQKNTVYQVSNGLHVNQVPPQASAPRQASRQTAFVISGDTWQTASDGAESHRRFYRGHDLTAAFDSGEFSRNVADGSFRDIFPGDYIIRKITVPAVANLKTSTYDVKFIIADLDIAMNQGSPTVTAHHAVIVPEKPVFSTYMNPTDTNAGGYAGSYMHKTVMPAFAKGLIGAFGEKHLLKSSFDDYDMAAAPLSGICRLMTLSMVFGQAELPSAHGWSDFEKDNCMGEAQFAAFRLHTDLKGSHFDSYWVSDRLSFSPSWTFAFLACVLSIGGKVFACSPPPPPAKFIGVRPFALLV